MGIVDPDLVELVRALPGFRALRRQDFIIEKLELDPWVEYRKKDPQIDANLAGISQQLTYMGFPRVTNTRDLGKMIPRKIIREVIKQKIVKPVIEAGMEAFTGMDVVLTLYYMTHGRDVGFTEENYRAFEKHLTGEAELAADQEKKQDK